MREIYALITTVYANNLTKYAITLTKINNLVDFWLLSHYNNSVIDKILSMWG